MKRPRYTVFGRRTDYAFAYDLFGFDTLDKAVRWKEDFQAGRAKSPNGYPYHAPDTLHIMDNQRGYEVDERNEQVIYNDWLTGKPIAG